MNQEFLLLSGKVKNINNATTINENCNWVWEETSRQCLWRHLQTSAAIQSRLRPSVDSPGLELFLLTLDAPYV